MKNILSFLSITLLLVITPIANATQDFDAWLTELKAEAKTQGIAPTVLNNAFTGVTLLSRVIELDRHQPEKTMSFQQYLQNILPASRISQARYHYQEHRELLEEISARYEVQPQFLVAFWAIESDFGRNQGGFSVIAALTTLAHDGRRSAYFRSELLDALRILQRGDVTPARMKGSWAGAMGQAQFMPSVFLKYGVDYDGNGRRDIWGNSSDVLASAANYLNNSGWHGNENWGTEVRLPSNFDAKLLGLEQTKTLNDWGTLGVSHIDGRSLTGNLNTSILQVDNTVNRIFAVYPNYQVIRTWNRSNYFATTVGLLADAIVAMPAVKEKSKKKINKVENLPRRLYPLSIPRDG